MKRRIAIVSDVHYACAAEQARGDDYEYRDITNPFLRAFVHAYRHFVWLRHPLQHGALLDQFIERAGLPDLVVANGDYSCDSAFVGVSDDAAFASARECLDKLRGRFAPNFYATIGDHELGKQSFIGGKGGMRLASWHQTRKELGLAALWQVEMGDHLLVGVASSLIALPVFEADALPDELPAWRELREEHLTEVRRLFAGLKPSQRVLLFCHDPTALPFLWRDETIRAKVSQIEQTVIGHLHTNLVFWKSGVLAGMPRIRFLGHTTTRISSALSDARNWRPFRVRLCPALAGTQLLNDGGYLTVELDTDARQPAVFQFHPIRR